MTSPDTGAAATPDAPADTAVTRAGAGGAGDGQPVEPEQSPEDTDAAWGEYPAPGDDHLYRDRPPHWDDF
jgi:hypothetical protein